MPFGDKPGYGSLLSPTSLAAARAVGETEQPQQDNIYKRSERSLVASGLVATPAAGTQICIIQGFRDAKQFAMYRLDWFAYIAVADGVSNDFVLALGGVPFFTLPVPLTHGLQPVTGTLYLAPNGADVEIDAIAGSGSASYGAALIMTRMIDGSAVG